MTVATIPSNTIAEDAVQLARDGLFIFPCRANKKPYTTHGFHDASKDEATVRAWWKRWLDAAIGLRTGEENNVVVLDVDMDKVKGKDGEASLKELCRRENGTLPKTRTARTPRGGQHLYYLHPGKEVPNSTDKLGIGLDIRGDGGYAIMPPSRVSTGQYTWENDEPPAELPAWLEKLIVKPVRQEAPPPAQRVDDIPDQAKVEDAVSYLSSNCPDGDWWTVGMALHNWSPTEGFAIWDAWSREAKERYEEGVTKKRWKSFKAGGGITIKSLFKKAIDNGWEPLKSQKQTTTKQTRGGHDDDILVLPGGSTSITKSAKNIFRRIAPSHELFIRGGAVMELHADDSGGLRLEILRAQTFRSRIEKLGKLFAWRVGKKNEAVLKPTTCPADTAEALLSSQEAADILPRVRGLAACPVLVEVDGQAQVLAKGYHSVNGGLLVTAGKKPPDMTIDEAVEALQLLVADFDFATPSDRSRALAAFITTALRIGGWLRGHIPIDMAEANVSQAGKGYRQNLIFAVYGEEPYRIALRDGGVGGLDESIQQALITGRPFIQIDNVRGHLESQFIEMMTTAGGTVGARVPHKGEVLIDSRHFVLMMTSNGVETTRDLANRSSIIRIRKRPGYVFRTFPEGDLLDHVKANQPYFLGAVFAVIRAWNAAGKPRTTDTRHDFREWAQVLGWIVETILGEAPLMAGHEQAQERVSNPALTWLRRVALAVEADQRLDEEIMAGSIGELCEAHAIEIPGLHDGSDETKRNQRIGILMKKSFVDTAQVEIDRCTIRRVEAEKYDQAEQRFRTLKSYVFALQATEAKPSLPHNRRTAQPL